MKKVGKIGKKLLDQRATFIAENPGPYYCYYCLYIGVEEELDVAHVQIEHFYTKNNHPELRFARENLVLSCSFHNRDKGGTDGPEYLAKLDKQMKGKNNGWY